MRVIGLLAVFSVGIGFLLWALVGRPGPSLAQVPVKGPQLIVYSGTNFTGGSLEVTGTLPDLPKVKNSDGTEFDWNDSIRSMKVLSGTWRLYQHGRCNTMLDDTPVETLDVSTKAPEIGWWCLVTGPVEIPSPEFGGWGEDISSIELVSPLSLPAWATK